MRIPNGWAAPLAAIVVTTMTAPGAASAEPVSETAGRMSDAHGGLEAWRSLQSMAFDDSWSTGMATHVTMDVATRRGRLEISGTPAAAAWDGEKVWSVSWPAEMPPPRFLVGLNWYFLNLPWVAHDPGVELAAAGTVTLGDDPKEYLAVRMTFGAGVGDTPDDYYLLYVDPETYRLHGCEYVVTYRAILPEGVEHTPPHDLIFEAFTEIGGLVLPTAFTVYEKDGSVYASCRVEGWALDEPFDESMVRMPAGAVVDESQP